MSLETLRLNIKATLDAMDTPRAQIGFFLSYHPPLQYPKPDNVKITANSKFQSLSLSLSLSYLPLVRLWLSSYYFRWHMHMHRPYIYSSTESHCFSIHPAWLAFTLYCIPSFWKHSSVFLLLKWTHHKWIHFLLTPFSTFVPQLPVSVLTSIAKFLKLSTFTLPFLPFHFS